MQEILSPSLIKFLALWLLFSSSVPVSDPCFSFLYCTFNTAVKVNVCAVIELSDEESGLLLYDRSVNKVLTYYHCITTCSHPFEACDCLSLRPF